MTAKTNLTDILTMLIRSDEKAHRRLERGLTLAYTGSVNGGCTGWRCRAKVFPSQEEIEIVRRDLYKALADANRSRKSSAWSRTGRWRDAVYHVLFGGSSEEVAVRKKPPARGGFFVYCASPNNALARSSAAVSGRESDGRLCFSSASMDWMRSFAAVCASRGCRSFRRWRCRG